MKMVTTAFWFSSSNRFQMSSLLKMFKNGILKYSIFFIFLIEKLSFFKYKFIYFNWRLLYNIALVLPYINMNLPWVYMCSPSWTSLPPPSPFHLSGSSQCTSPEQEELSYADKITLDKLDLERLTEEWKPLFITKGISLKSNSWLYR